MRCPRTVRGGRADKDAAAAVSFEVPRSFERSAGDHFKYE
jgi:hypothetical protein